MPGFEATAEELCHCQKCYWEKEASDGSAFTHSSSPENSTGGYPGQLSSAPGQGFTSAPPVVLSLLPKVGHVGTQHLAGGLPPPGLLVFLGKSKKNINQRYQLEIKKRYTCQMKIRKLC